MVPDRKTRVLLKRVVCGSDFMDRKFPAWWSEINLDMLDISKIGYCVLGQIYGNYWHALDILNLSNSKCEELGFALPERENCQDWENWNRLTEAWKMVIRHYRRKAGK